ncbi:MAG: Na-translocating system protein MpsC family protein [Anaerovoracaceae bacterium]
MGRKSILTQLSVLYVEDDMETLEEMKTFLKRRVGKVYLAKDGEDGIKKCSESNPDIIISDILMPKIEGIEMLKEIRNLGYKMPFIITSTKGEASTIIETVDLGIVKYIIKPIVLRELEECLLALAEEKTREKYHNEEYNLEEKKQMEAQIKAEWSVLIKRLAGKGPRDVVVFIHNNSIEVVAYDTLTIMESTALRINENRNQIKQNRRMFYETIERDIISAIEKIIGTKIVLENIDIDLKARDKITFRLI